MKTLHVTGIEFLADRCVARVVSVTRRWWQRKKHYVLTVYEGTYGAWTAQRTGKPAPKDVWKLLDRELEAAYGGAASPNVEVRTVSRPSSH